MNKILLVDDSAIICQKTKALLNKENHHVEIAAGGAKAFAKIEETDFDLILLDIEMPEMTGFDVCRKLRSEKKTELLPVVVFYTDNIEPDTKVEGLHLGASDFISKNQARSHPKEFLSRIEAHLKIAQLTRDRMEKIKRLEIFKVFSHSITAIFGLERLLKQIMEMLQDVLNVEATSLFFIDRETEELAFYVPTGEQDEFLKKIKLKSNEGIAGWVAKTGTPLLIHDPYKDKRFCQDMDNKTGFITRSILAVPLKIREKIVGVVEVLNKKGGKHFTDEDMDLLSMLSGQIAITIDNTGMTEDLKISRDQIRNHNKILEIRIKERTQKLEENNLTLQKTNRELKKAYRKLEDAQAQLLQSEKMAGIGQLAAGIAHEINNPIGFISSNLTTFNEYIQDITRLIQKYEELGPNNFEKIRREVEDLKREVDIGFILQDIKNLAGESLEGTERVKKIVTDLKDFSHVDESELKYADINKGLESALNIIRNEIKYKAEVIKEYGELPEVLCYPMQLNQVFMNILLNAVQAIEKKGEIKISTNYNNKGNYAEVRIKDTGSGISEENIKKIFNPFFTTKDVGKGTGLGLSISYGIIKKHKGKIDINSEPGWGSEFIITLPVGGVTIDD